MYGGSRIPGTGLLYKVEATRVPLVKRSGPYEIQREDQPQQNYLVFQSPRPLELLGMRDEDAKVCTLSLWREAAVWEEGRHKLHRLQHQKSSCSQVSFVSR